jgi:hypothetical protein
LSLWGISCGGPLILYIGFAALSVFLVWITAPIENENNPLNLEKKKQMKVLCRIVSVVMFTVIFLVSILSLSKCYWIAASLAYGMVSHALLILAAKLQAYSIYRRNLLHR